MVKKIYFQPNRVAIVERADRIPVTAQEVILKDILIRRKLTILAGPSQSGKGHVEAALACRVSVGGSHPSWPDKTPNRPGKVLICSGYEDDPSDTFIPRLQTAGANLANIFFFRGLQEFGKSVKNNFGPSDVEAIVRAISVQCGNGFDVLIVDPVFQAIEGDSASQSAVTRALNNLAAIAIRMNVAVLAVTHVVKAARGRDSLARIAGPLAYATIGRSVWVTAHNPHRNSESFDYVLVNAKSSNSKPGGGWGYSIVDAIGYDEFGPQEGSVIRWDERFSGRAEETLQQVERCSHKKAETREKAENFLISELKGKSVPYPDILLRAANQGISSGTLVRAKKILGVISAKETGVKHGRSIWSLPN
ncbi:AAA family ATPase [Undibacterium sp.]|uniref:AAA family ATPase n=1 Tax=Undibacterium sp. TaxID=1914977 RepID=UPI0025D121FD|nr:AAA family ATPase [Undibacterium sp.]